MASRFGIKTIKFDKSEMAYKDEYVIDESSPSIIRDPNKCIHCGDCVRMCSEKQNVGAIDFAERGYELKVCPAFDMPLAETECVNCGQCSAVCPTGAIVVKDDTKAVWDAIYDDNKRVVVQVAPAVRVAMGEEWEMPEGTNVMPILVAAMRRIGFDEIYDTSFSADLTIMEETAEFLEKLESGKDLPLFTSCCPAWIKYVENKRPEMMPHVSSCKSPQQMFGSVYKEYARKNATDDKETVVVSIMPCTAKKGEAIRDEFVKDEIAEVDYVLTTQELSNMIYEAGIEFKNLEPEANDMPFGLYSGAGVLFGVTGGVTEAVIRKVVEDKSHQSFENIKFIGARGLEGVKEFELPLSEEKSLKIAVVSGLKNADDLIQKMQDGVAQYDFVEVMACPNGCVNGGGQPYSKVFNKEKRAQGLYSADKLSRIKYADANPVIDVVYRDVIKDKAHDLLHVDYK
jgi:NADH-quinone oxidoreductase subunit G